MSNKFSDTGKADPIAPNEDEINTGRHITEEPNINEPAIDEPSTGDHDHVGVDIEEDQPGRQMQAETADGMKAANSLHHETQKEEHKVELKIGGQLPKGEERFDERSKSSDGKSAGEKQA
jgi:hypothetical protein